MTTALGLEDAGLGRSKLVEGRPRCIHLLELKACQLPPISEGGANYSGERKRKTA